MTTQNYINYPRTDPLKHLNQTDTQRYRHGHRNRILIQLEEVYSKALDSGSYPSALKAVELNIKMLNLMESPQARVKMEDFNDETMQNLMQDIKDEYGDFSLSQDYPESAQPPKHHSSQNYETKSTHRYQEEPEEPRMEPPPQIQPQVPPTSVKKSSLPRLSTLSTNDLQSLLAEVNQMEAEYSSPGSYSQNTPKPKGNSAIPSLASLDIEAIKQLIKEAEEDLGLQTSSAFAASRGEIYGKKSVPKAEIFRGVPQNGDPDNYDGGVIKENTQPKFQAGQQLKNKPG
jgi:hypothetical protein